MSTRDFSNIQEKAVAKALGGHVTANSGATMFAKADVIAGDVIVECKTKTVDCNAFSIQKAWLEQLEKDRRDMSKRLGALAFTFDVGKTNYYVIDEEAMKRIVELVSLGEW